MAVHIQPHLVVADAEGNIYDDPDLLMVCRKGAEWCLPRPDELMPLPPESELFLLPGAALWGLTPKRAKQRCKKSLRWLLLPRQRIPLGRTLPM